MPPALSMSRKRQNFATGPVYDVIRVALDLPSKEEGHAERTSFTSACRRPSRALGNDRGGGRSLTTHLSVRKADPDHLRKDRGYEQGRYRPVRPHHAGGARNRIHRDHDTLVPRPTEV